jgi:hypothetical protein
VLNTNRLDPGTAFPKTFPVPGAPTVFGKRTKCLMFLLTLVIHLKLRQARWNFNPELHLRNKLWSIEIFDSHPARIKARVGR